MNYDHLVTKITIGRLKELQAVERKLLEIEEEVILYWSALNDIIDGPSDGEVTTTELRHIAGEALMRAIELKDER